MVRGEPDFNSAILLSSWNGAATEDAAHKFAQENGLQPLSLPASCAQAAPVEKEQTTTTETPARPAGHDAAKVATVVTKNTTTTTVTPEVKTCVYEVKALIDDRYRRYRIDLHHFADQGEMVADLAVLGVTTAATGPVSVLAKTVLSAVGTFIGGGKTIVSDDLLHKQAIEILLNQMDSDRDQQFTLMIKEMAGTYTLAQAKDDLLAYFAAGTWDHAITSLQNKAAVSQANCKAETNTTKLKATKSTAGKPAQSKSSSTGCPANASQE